MEALTITIRDMKIGEGKPKICIPIVGKTAQEILCQAKGLLAYPVDLVEWRADWYENLASEASLTVMLADLRKELGELPILFTIRTTDEGGLYAGSWQEYCGLNKMAAKSGCVDLVDVEVFKEESSEGLIKELKSFGVTVIGSSHNFRMTPKKDELVERLKMIQEKQADICKLAVMPNCQADVVNLLAATWEMKEKWADRPLITMSMGKLGVISRLSGELFGSAITFGAAGAASAPGQIGADALADYLDLLHADAERKPDVRTGHLFLIGFMGAGKSTVAAELKQRLGWNVIEMDEAIEKEAGQTIASMFEQYGETYFRDKETKLLLSLEKELPAIVSCGGGVVVREENCAFMKTHGKIILLTAAPETVLERIKENEDRPILKGNMNVEYIQTLQDKRRALYEAVADVVIATDGKSVETICEEIINRL